MKYSTNHFIQIRMYFLLQLQHSIMLEVLLMPPKEWFQKQKQNKLYSKKHYKIQLLQDEFCTTT